MSDNKPFNVYITEEFKDGEGKDQTLRTKVGAAFPHSKGGGFNIVLRNGLAVSGRLVVFPPKDDDASNDD